MSSFEREFNSAVEAVERDVFINLVCENPQLTLAELTKLGKGKFANLLSSVCVGDIIQNGRGSGGPREFDDDDAANDDDGEEDEEVEEVEADDDRPTKTKSAKGKNKAKAVNTRTPEGRKEYDAAVLAVVEQSERPIKAPEITSKVGGTALQVRKALARLIEASKVTWEGKARGMRYSVV